MTGWVECVVRFKEGTGGDRARILEDVVGECDGVVSLGVDPGLHAHLRILSIAGTEEAVRLAAVRIVRAAVALGTESDVVAGAWPGVIEEVSIVPVAATSLGRCVRLSRRLGEDLSGRLALPVYLVEASRPPGHESPGTGRERLTAESASAEALPEPDFAPVETNPAAGCVALGAHARWIQLAVEISTAGSGSGTAASLADRLRREAATSWTLRVELDPGERPSAPTLHVTLLDPGAPSLSELHRCLGEAARAEGVRVTATRVVGALPEDAVVELGLDRLGLSATDGHRVVERAIRSSGRAALSRRVASTVPAPGGGAVVAHTGQLASCLTVKVLGISLRRRLSGADRSALAALQRRAGDLTRDFERLHDEDQDAFLDLLAALRRSRRGRGELAAGSDGEVEKETRRAIEVPLTTMDAACRLLELVQEIAGLAASGKIRAEADVAVAADLARGVLSGSIWNVRVNLAELEDDGEAGRYRRRCRELEARFDGLYAGVRRQLGERLGP